VLSIWSSLEAAVVGRQKEVTTTIPVAEVLADTAAMLLEKIAAVVQALNRR
jgi:hypothetical protein